MLPFPRKKAISLTMIWDVDKERYFERVKLGKNRYGAVVCGESS